MLAGQETMGLPGPALIPDAPVGIATGGNGNPTDAASVLQQLKDLQLTGGDTANLARSPIRDPLVSAMQTRLGVDATQASDDRRKHEEGLAGVANAVSPEMTQAYADRQAARDAYYAEELDPALKKSRKIDALLAGFATPGGIAKSGIAALAGTRGVDDASREARLTQEEERFDNTKELAGLNRTARIATYEAGSKAAQVAYERASAGINQAAQTLGALATSEETRAQALAIAALDRDTNALNKQLEFIIATGRIDATNRATSQRTYDTVLEAVNDYETSIFDLQGQAALLGTKGPELDAINALITDAQTKITLLQTNLAPVAARLGITNQTSGMDEGNDVIDFSDL